MTEILGHYEHQWERLRWARLRAGFERVKDAADSLGIKPVTYRTYEHAKAEGGREPTLSELQRISRKFKVSWVWVATGEGSPEPASPTDERLAKLRRAAEDVPAEKQDDAINAALGVLEVFRKRA